MLDPSEDWRLPVDQRVDDLVPRMTLDEKAGLMLIDTLNAECDPGTQQRGVLGPAAADVVEDQHMHRFIFRNTVTSEDKAVCGAPGDSFRAGTRLTPGSGPAGG